MITESVLDTIVHKIQDDGFILNNIFYINDDYISGMFIDNIENRLNVFQKKTTYLENTICQGTVKILFIEIGAVLSRLYQGDMISLKIIYSKPIYSLGNEELLSNIKTLVLENFPAYELRSNLISRIKELLLSDNFDENNYRAIFKDIAILNYFFDKEVVDINPKSFMDIYYPEPLTDINDYFALKNELSACINELQLKKIKPISKENLNDIDEFIINLRLSFFGKN